MREPRGVSVSSLSARGDVHRDFEAETQVGIGGGGPLHGYLLESLMSIERLANCEACLIKASGMPGG